MELMSTDGKEWWEKMLAVDDWELYINAGDFLFRALIENTILEKNKKEWIEGNKTLDKKDLYTHKRVVRLLKESLSEVLEKSRF